MINNMERREALRGACIAVIGGIFWGLAGVRAVSFCVQRSERKMACQCPSGAGGSASAYYGVSETRKRDVEDLEG